MKQAFIPRYLISFISKLLYFQWFFAFMYWTLRHFVRTDAVGVEMGRTRTVCLLYRTNQPFSIGRTEDRKKNATDVDYTNS